MEIKTVIAIPARGSGRVGSQSNKRRKQGMQISIDHERLRELSDQLTDLVEELDDIKEDLNAMMSEMKDSFDSCDYDEDENASDPIDRMEDICAHVDAAFEELNEALDGMEELE